MVTALEESRTNLTARIKEKARSLGFDLVGITSADPLPDHGERLAHWLSRGFHGQMAYMARKAQKAADPRAVVPEAQSVIVVGMYYRAREEEPPQGTLRGQVSCYAWGEDYHLVMGRRLEALAAYLKEKGAKTARWYVDTGPLLDRALAQRAGIGWFGKNTTIISRPYGSWIFLGLLLTDLELSCDEPAFGDCGLCALCMEQCPTGAILAPYLLDARRCISYLTIEHRGWIPRDLRPLIGNMIFGCDICQEVCPWNRTHAPTLHPEFQPRPEMATPELLPLLHITEEEFQVRFRGTAIKRTKRSGLRRNVAMALGNLRDPQAVPALVRALSDPDPIVRGHAAWALGRIGGEDAHAALVLLLEREENPEVREEIVLALEDMRKDRGEGGDVS
ncbi:MAG: tRNA epoxyqueuosine(34) reductase QueG [Armatimonadota bacterium]|nr:tRNA epoxyqueuosine(34) reductase QueG [Armatimonadota bacterium]